MAAFEFNVPLTRDASNWGTSLVDTLKQSFTQISKQIADNNVKPQIEQLTLTITEAIQTINSTNETAHEALRLAQSNASDIVLLREEFREMKSLCNDLKAENVELKQRADDSEIYSRKENLVIKGIAEKANETDEQCVSAVKLFFTNHLNIDGRVVESMKFVRCHRLGVVTGR